MVRIFSALLFLISFSCGEFVFAAEVRFQGVSAYELQLLKKKLPELNQANPSLATLDRAIRALMTIGNYSNVSILEDGKGVRYINAVPMKKVGEIVVTGNNNFDEEDIVATLGLKVGARFDASRLARAIDNLKEFYGKNGYLNTSANFAFEEMRGDSLRIRVQVKERQPCQIKGFTFNTENNSLKERLNRTLRRYVSENMTEENITNIDEAINEFLEDHNFINTKVPQKKANYNNKGTEVILEYDVSDPYSYEIIFRNNNELGTGKLLSGLKLETFQRGSLDPAQDVLVRAKEVYLSEGFPHVKIQFKDRVVDKEFRKFIILDINEGEKVRIDLIDVVGRISRPNEYYAKIIKSNSSDAVEDGFYVKEDLDNGVKNLVTALNNEGYLRAKVQSTRTEFNEKRNRATVTVLLDEGPLTQLSKISFSGVRSFSEKQLLNELSITSNAPLKLNLFEDSIADLKAFYKSRGFIEMRLANENAQLITYDEKGLSAHVHFEVIEGPQVFVKDIYVDGNTFTKDYVVLRQLNIERGDLLTPDLLDEARKRVEKLGIFSRVELRTSEANTNVSNRTLIVNVTERNPGLFRIGAGVTNKRELTVRGYSGISYLNLGGTARAISLRGSLESSVIDDKYLEYEVGAGYLEPFIFDQKWRGRANYTRSEKVVDEYTDYLDIRRTDRLTFTAEKDITSKIKFSWLLWGFDNTEKFQAFNSGPDRDLYRTEIGYIGPSLDIDFRDNPFLPTKGIYTRFDSDFSSKELGSSDGVNFVRVQGLFSFYQRLGSPKWVWANSIHGGWGKNLSKETGSGIPDSFAFFLGDYTTIRGYDGTENDRIPSKYEFPYDEDEALIIPFETKYYLIKSELRYPLGSGILGGVLFYDAGEVFIQDAGYDPRAPFKQTLGLGFRINTPFGPISLDYGRKLHRLNPKESPDQWHLSIGTF